MASELLQLLSVSGGVEEETDPFFNQVTGLYHFDGSNGGTNATFTDSSGNSHSITASGHTTQGTFSPFSVADGNWSTLYNAGTDGTVYGNNSFASFGTGDFTIEFWVNFTELELTKMLFDFRSASNTSASYLHTSSGSASGAWNLGDADGNYMSGAGLTNNDFTVGTWHHLAISRASSTTKVFLDGTEKASVSDTGNYDSTDLTIGGRYSGSYSIKGYISNFRILKGTGLYTSNFTPPTTPLTNVTNTVVRGNSTNSFIDSYSAALAITTNGTPKIQPFSPFVTSKSYNSGNNGGSGYFDETGDYLSTNDSDLALGTGDFTIEGWMYFAATPVAMGFFQISNGTLNSQVRGPAAGVDGSTGRWGIYHGTTYLVHGSEQPEQNAWYHVAFVRNSSTSKLYVNGVEKLSVSDTTDYTDTYLTVGGWYSSSYLLNGYISGFRIVKGTAVYTSAFTPPTAPLTAVTNTELLLNFTNGAIFDNSMKGNAAVFGNAALSTAQKKFGTTSLILGGDSDTDFLVLHAQENFSGPFTIECWARADDTGNGYMWCVGQYQLECGIDGDNLRTYSAGTGYTNFFTSGEFTVNTWHHVAVVRDTSNVVKMYLNGTASSTTFTYSSAYAATNNVVIIGGEYTSTTSIGHGWDGYIDEFRISRKARYTSDFVPAAKSFPNAGKPLTSGTIAVTYVIISGGGGGGKQGGAVGMSGGGGGGAGGVVTGTTNISSGTAVTVTVGAGGAGITGNVSTQGNDGTASSIATISTTSVAGGGGARGTYPTAIDGNDGGSGGGACNAGTPGSGTSGQGNDGGNGTASSEYGGGGGGGAGSVGGNAGSTRAGAGGSGTSAYSAWATATSTGDGGLYAGGGGGSGYQNAGTNGLAGSGGGGQGGSDADVAAAGDANTGGGGGGGGGRAGTYPSAAGGSGIVMIRYAGSQAATGGSVVTTGGFTYHTFITSGTFTNN